METNNNLTIGNVFSETFRTFSKNFIKLIIPSVLCFGLPYILYMAYFQATIGDAEQYYGAYSTTVFSSQITGSLVYSLFNMAFYIYMVRLTSNLYTGREESTGSMILLAVKRLIPFIILTILVSIMIAAGFILLIIPGIILALALCVYQQIFVIEDKKITATIKRSFALTNKKKGKLFLIFLIAFLVMIVISMIFALFIGGGITAFVAVGTEAAALPLTSIIIMTVVMLPLYPLSFSMLNAIYYNLLKDKEGFHDETLADEFMSEEDEVE